MDKAWFRAALRKSGKTTSDLARAIDRDRAVVSRIMNGHQSLSLDQAKAFATTLDIPVDIVLLKSGLTDEPTAQVFRPGFSESDAIPFVPQGASGRSMPSIAEAFGAKPGVDVWTIKTQSLALMGYMPGDYMLVDTHQAERVKSGDVVLAQIYDNANGSAATVLRRFEPPVLVAASMSPDERRVHIVDGVNVVIVGKVTASWRV